MFDLQTSRLDQIMGSLYRKHSCSKNYHDFDHPFFVPKIYVRIFKKNIFNRFLTELSFFSV